MATQVTEDRPTKEVSFEPPARGATPRRKSRAWIWLLVLAALAYGGWHYRGVFSSSPATPKTGSGGGRGAAGTVIPVAVATAVHGDIPVYLRGIGTAAAFNTVTVHSRVDGQLMSVAFQEGQYVHAGDVLAEIDPRPYQVQLEQAQGQLAHDTALLNDAQLNANRYAELFKEGVISKQQADTQQALVGQYEGAIRTDQGAIDSARLNLNYCKITAPLTGRIGLRLVDAGNLVHASDPNGLVVITQLQPIAVLFSLPQDNLPEVNKQLRAGVKLAAEAYDKDGTTKLASGTLVTIDNQIDPTTDTYKLKAVFPNEDNALFPNQFVNVRLLEGSQKGLTIVPTPAVQRGPQGSFVYVVTPAATVSLRPVTIVIAEGNETGISAGLQPGETVVTDGQDKLQDGTPVKATPASQAPGAASTNPARAAGSSAPAPTAVQGKNSSTSAKGRQKP